jgi:hypothetical protein
MTQSKLHPYQRKALALCFAIALLSFPCTVQAFSAAAGPAKSQRAAAAAAAATSQTRLHAWTLPNGMTGSHSNGLGMFKATWYDDHHPTARKVVYNDE